MTVKLYPAPQRPASLTADDLVARARDLLPGLRKRAVETEERRRLPDATIAELKEAGFARYFTPARYGGLEMDWPVQVRIGREIAKACGSTAWISTVVLSHTWLVGRLPKAAQDAVWAEGPDTIIATGFAGGSTLERVKGGYRVNGLWRFASGVDHSDWVMLAGSVTGLPEGAPPEKRLALLHRSEVTVLDTWFAAGLKGTGSNDVRADNVFVPDDRAIEQFAETVRPPGAELHPSYIYGVETLPYFRTLILGPILGAAQGAMNDYLEMTRGRIGQMRGEAVAQQIPVQGRIAESAAEFRAAELLAWDHVDALHALGASGQRYPGPRRLTEHRDLAYIARLCRTGVDRLAQMQGATGQTAHNPVHRHLRDISAMTSHGSLQWEFAASPYGRWALGLPSGDATADAQPRGPDENL